MNRTVASVMVLLLVGAMPVAGVSTPTAWAAVSTHHVIGKVMAVNVEERPQTIVLTTSGNTGEMVVGATLGQRTTIRRGKKMTSLDRIRVGEMVQMIYQKTSTGLVAVSITAK